MGETTAISWCHHTFNPWRGCEKVSAGCKNCYAETQAKRSPGVLGVWGKHGTRVVASESMWKQPLRWDRDATVAGERRRVFCASMADWLEDRCDLVEPRARLMDLIRDTPNLDWLLLTKRPENWKWAMVQVYDLGLSRPQEKRNYMVADWLDGKPPANVWIGFSAEDQETFDYRAVHAAEIPCRVRFVSGEPLLGGIVMQGERNGILRNWLDPKHPRGVHWVIVGGESGPNARPMHSAWATSLRDQCVAAGVAFHFKQWGEWRPPVDGEEYNTGFGRSQKTPAFLVDLDGTVNCFYPHDDDAATPDACRCKPMLRVGKRSAGRLLDGREWNEFPTVKGAS